MAADWKPHRYTERGNIFFALFGAVALVGVVGAATSTLMRGPVSTVVAVNQRAKADTQMQIASKLAMVRAAQEANNGDCDADSTIEPIPPDGDVGLVGGGGLPTQIGASQIDPWNTRYGYCAWDLGSVVDDAACGGSGSRLRGGNNESYPVMVIISAGPDKLFQTSCEAWGPVDGDGKPTNAATLINSNRSSGPNDDIVLGYTYTEAVQAAGGLWSLMAGDPDTITTDKNVAFSSGTTANFQGTAQFAQDSRLDLRPRDSLGNSLGGGTFLLPTQDDLKDNQCNAANAGALRINTKPDYLLATDPTLTEATILEICDTTTIPSGFQPVGGKGITFKVGGDDGELQFNSNGSLDGASGLIWAPGSGSLGIGATPTATLDVSGKAKVSETLDVADSVTSPRFNFDASNGMSHDAGGININSATGIELNSTSGIDFKAGGHSMVLTSTGNLGIGVSNPNDALEVDGDAQIAGETLSRRFVASYLGSAGNPAFAFGSSSGLGLYAGSNDLGFAIGGATQAILNPTGLGIGTTPDVALDVLGAGKFTNTVTATGFQFSSGQGMYQDGTGLTLNASSGPQFYLSGLGNVGIGQASPTTALDVNGAVRVGYVGDAACTSERTGALRYSESGDVLQVCSSNGNFETIGTSGGGGGGSGSYWTRISNIDTRLYYVGGAVGVGVAEPLATLHANGNFLTTGTYGSGSDVPVEGEGTRMMFVPKKGAFRVGGVNGAHWNNNNVGNYSLGLGYNTVAPGDYTVSIGNGVTTRGTSSIAIGSGSTSAFGESSIAIGRGVHVGDPSNPLLGRNSIGFGLGVPSGNLPKITGSSSYGIFMGNQGGVNITTDNLMALVGGRMLIDPTSVSASNVVPSGSLTLDVNGDIGAIQYCDENGANCFTAGSVGSAHGPDGEIQFASAGQFWSSPDLVFSSATNNVGIGAPSPTHKLQVGGTVRAAGLVLDPVSGAGLPIGMMLSDLADTEIDSPTSGDLLRFNSGKWENFASESLSTSAAGANREIQFNSNGAFGSSSKLIYSTDGTFIVTGTYSGASTGASPATAAGTYMFFDPLKSAFRAGTVSGTQWNNGNTGAYSVAMGLDTTSAAYSIAAGQNTRANGWAAAFGSNTVAGGYGIAAGNGTSAGAGSAAFGENTHADGSWSMSAGRHTFATGYDSFAFGHHVNATGSSTLAAGSDATASGQFSHAIGNYVTASGTGSMALGTRVATGTGSAGVSGNFSMALGLGDGGSGSSISRVTGKAALGIFMDSQSNQTFAADKTMGLFGGNFVIDPKTAATQLTARGVLDLGGASDAIVLPAGANADRPATLVNGMLRYNSTSNKFEGYQNGMWQDILTGAITGGAGSPDRGIQFNSGGSFGASSNMIYSPSGTLMVAGTHTGAGAPPSSGPGTRMFFDPTKSAFRAGATTGTGTAWDNANIGPYSAAFGTDTIASGSSSFAAGDQSVASGTASFAAGQRARATGGVSVALGYQTLSSNASSTAMGAGSTASGEDSTAMGAGSTASGDTSTAIGASSTANGDYSVAIGGGAVSSGARSLAMGSSVLSSGLYSIAMGRSVVAGNASAGSGQGDGSMAIGLFDDAVSIPTWPEVRGIQSMGIFMGSQSGRVMTAQNTMGLFGGQMVIDPRMPALQLAARSVLDLGGATDSVVMPSGTTAERPATLVNGMLRYNSTNNKFEGYQNGSWQDIVTGAVVGGAGSPDRGIQFNSGGAFAASSNLLYSTNGTLMVAGTYGGGGPAAPVTGAGPRMFFNPTNSAFRAGRVDGTQWDTIGQGSIALGHNPIASGLESVAIGDGSATNNFSIAIGGGSATGIRAISVGSAPGAASGGWSTVIGSGFASGQNSIMIGRGAYAGNGTSGNGLGDGSLAIGLVDDAVTLSPSPKVLGLQSMGVFIGDQGSGVSMTANNTVGFFGGNMVIDPRIPSSQLAARSVIDVGAATDSIVMPSGTTAQRPATLVNGMLRYNSTNNKFEGYQNGSWQDILTGALTGGASSPDRGIQFNSGGTFGATANMVYSAAGAFMVSGTYTGVGAPPATGTGVRMFFDPTKAAFRAGFAGATTWDNANVGVFSFAGGGQTIASGDSSVALGSSVQATGKYAVALGYGSQATAESATAFGRSTIASGYASTAMGTSAFASGHSSLAFGRSTVAGNAVPGSGLGDGSMAIGLLDDAVTLASPTQVTGIQSLGIFMGNQSAKVLAADNTMGVFGGTLVIDPRMPASQLAARSVIDVGAATDSIVMPSGTTAQRPATLVNGMLRYNSTNNKFEGYQNGAWVDMVSSGSAAAGATTQVQFNSGGSFAGNSGFVFNPTTTALTVQGGAQSSLIAMTSNASGWAVNGFATSATGPTAGLFGQATSTGGSGVYAIASATTGATFGLRGQADSTSGTAVYGLATATTGATFGLRGQADSTGGRGVYGHASATSGTTFGTMGQVDSAAGSGVYGLSTPTTGTGSGVWGQTSSTGSAMGVRGLAAATTGTAMGVYGQSNSPNGYGVYSSGNLYVTQNIEYVGTLTDVSDMRLKTDIHPLRERGSMLDKLGQIDAYSFRMKDDPQGTVEFGVMAQEMQKVFPELVKTSNSSPEHYLSVNYVGMIAPLVQATQELKAENDNLKSQLGSLESKMASIESDMKGMKAYTGYGIDKAGFGLGMAAGLLLVGGLGGAFMVGRRRKAA